MEEVVSQNFIPSAKVMFSPVSGIVGLSAGLQNKKKKLQRRFPENVDVGLVSARTGPD